MSRRSRILERSARSAPKISSLADLEREIAAFEAQVEGLGREEMATHADDHMPPPIPRAVRRPR